MRKKGDLLSSIERAKGHLTVVTSPATNEDGHPSDDQKHYSFEVVIGSVLFNSAWYFGNDEEIEKKRKELTEAFRLSQSDVTLKF